MNLHFSYKTSKSPEIEKEITQHVNKLTKRLHAFRPELVHLHGTLDTAPLNSFKLSLNLRLPSGQLSSHDSASSPESAVKNAFSDLLMQLQRHKEFLRSEHRWRRDNVIPKGVIEATELAAEDVTEERSPRNDASGEIGSKRRNGEATHQEITEATFESPHTVQTDVRSYINANLPRLERYVGRELRYRESIGQLQPHLVPMEEVIDEVVVTALSVEEKPTQFTLERWLYRLAIQAINRLAEVDGVHPDGMPLEESVGAQNVSGSDEAFLQFHQPGDTLIRQDVIADPQRSNPEAVAANDELMDQLEQALRGASPDQREAFVLFTIEGFTVEEISQVTDRNPEKVRHAISSARNHLLKKLPSGNALKKKLIQGSDVA